MGYCSNCGAKLTEGQKFCGECATPATSPPPAQPSKPKGGNKGLLITLIIVGALVLISVPLVLVLGGLFFFMDSGESPPPGPPPPDPAGIVGSVAPEPTPEPPPGAALTPLPAPEPARTPLAELLGSDGFVLREFHADLAGTGLARDRWHKVHVIPTDVGPLGQRFGVVVTDAADGVIWESPRPDDDADPRVFGKWDHGECLPELLADIDADGKLELVAREAGGDVSPLLFRALEWNGQAFVHDAARSTIFLNSPVGGPSYPASDTDTWHGRWIHRLLPPRPGGEMSAEIWETDKSVSSVRMGKAVIKPGPAGFELVRWTEPMADARVARMRPGGEPVDPMFADPVDAFLSAWRMGSETEALEPVVTGAGGRPAAWYRELIDSAPGLRMNLGHTMLMARDHRGIGLVRVKVWLADEAEREFHFELEEVDGEWKIGFGE